MVATVLLVVAGVFLVGQQERLEAAFVAQLVLDHEKCFTQFGAGHPRLDAPQAEARLAAFGFDVSVPASSEDDQIVLVDVRSCDYDGGRMAHLLYEVAGQAVSFFVVRGAAAYRGDPRASGTAGAALVEKRGDVCPGGCAGRRGDGQGRRPYARL